MKTWPCMAGIYVKSMERCPWCYGVLGFSTCDKSTDIFSPSPLLYPHLPSLFDALTTQIDQVASSLQFELPFNIAALDTDHHRSYNTMQWSAYWGMHAARVHKKPSSDALHHTFIIFLFFFNIRCEGKKWKGRKTAAEFDIIIMTATVGSSAWRDNNNNVCVFPSFFLPGENKI